MGRGAKIAGYIALCLLLATSAYAKKAKILYSFEGGGDGASVVAPLMMDSKGDIYGTTEYGGDSTCDCGTVFRLTRRGVKTTLYIFGGADGAYPTGVLVSDDSGNLYGTTLHGGANGRGSVFRLTRKGKQRVLYSFTGGDDGGNPFAGLLRGADGNFYGTTSYGGITTCNGGLGCGTVFKITPEGIETVLYKFLGDTDGGIPQSGVIADASGALYGTTATGGEMSCPAPFGGGCGVVFKLQLDGTEAVLHRFQNTDGRGPDAALMMDPDENLYGSTTYGGRHGYGTLFKITNHHASVLYHFGEGKSGGNPFAGLIRDDAGNLYGTTLYGGNRLKGVVFELSPLGVYTVLHPFGAAGDGATLYAGLISDAVGNLYGATFAGGAHDSGTVFRIKPN